MREVIGEFKDSLSKPLSKEMPLKTIILLFILFLVVAFIVFDAMSLIKMWANEAAKASLQVVETAS